MHLRFCMVLCMCWCMTAPALAYEYDKGSAKVSLNGYLQAKGVAIFDHDTPEEHPTTEIGIECKTTVSTWSALKVFIQARDDGTVIDPENGKLLNEFNKVYQDKNPSVDIDEAYIDFYMGKADVRVGIQKFAWGRLDEINPTDNLNPEDYSQGAINDELDRKIGIPAVKVNTYSDLVNVELAWIPWYVPYRLPKPGERWYPGPLTAPDQIETNGTVGAIPVTAQHLDMDVPHFGTESSEAGVRVSKYIGGWDLSVSYYRGYDVMPVTDVFSTLTVDFENPLALDYSLALDLIYKPALHKMNVYGFDFTTTAGSFTIRGEFAYYQDKRYNRRLESVLSQELSRSKQEAIFDQFYQRYIDSGGQEKIQTFPINPQINIPYASMKYGLGVDYLFGDTSVSVQAIQEFIPDYDSSLPVYFIDDTGTSTLVTFVIRQLFLQNTLEVSLGGGYGIEFRDYAIRPSVKYHFTNSLEGAIGLVILGGKYPDSLFGQYRDNDEAYALLKCSF